MAGYPENPPNTLIVPGEDLLDAFDSYTGCRVRLDDLKEIITQVVQKLLNEENGDLEYLSSLPDFNRMRDPAFRTDDEYRKCVTEATLNFGVALHERLTNLGAYMENCFSYFFDDLLHRDFIFRNLPH